MAGEKRAEYPDSDHPLYTPNEDAQRQVVERIQQAKRGPRRKHPMNYTDQHGTLVLGSYAPMGEHPRVSDTDIGNAWGIKQSRANYLVNNPKTLNPWQVDELCDLLGVTLDWLRGWTTENAFGRYEAPDMVAELYDLLEAEDKQHVCYLLTRLLGDERVREVKNVRRKKRNIAWLDAHPDEANEMGDMALEIATELRQKLVGGIDVFREYFMSIHTADEWALMLRRGAELDANGYDAESFTDEQLLGRDNCVEP